MPKKKKNKKKKKKSNSDGPSSSSSSAAETLVAEPVLAAAGEEAAPPAPEAAPVAPASAPASAPAEAEEEAASTPEAATSVTLAEEGSSASVAEDAVDGAPASEDATPSENLPLIAADDADDTAADIAEDGKAEADSDDSGVKEEETTDSGTTPTSGADDGPGDFTFNVEDDPDDPNDEVDEDDEDDSNGLLASSKATESSSLSASGSNFSDTAAAKTDDEGNPIIAVTVNDGATGGGGKIQRRNTEFYLNQLQGKGLTHEHSMAALTQEKGDVRTRKRVFYMLLCMQLFANFDAGVVPSSLNTIMREYSLTQTEAGLLGSLVYVGLVVSCPITGYLLNVMKSQRRVLICSLVLNLTALLLFVLCPSDGKWLLMFTRFLTGLSQAPLFVFPPVWIDEFAPPASLTTWVSCLQAMVPLGIMFGYLFAAIFQLAFSDEMGWRVAIWMQIVVLCPFAIVYSTLRGRYFNVLGGKEARLMNQARKLQRSSIEDEIAAEESRKKDAAIEKQKKKEAKAALKAAKDAAGAGEGSSSNLLASDGSSSERATDMTVISTESGDSNEDNGGATSLRVDSLAMMDDLDDWDKDALTMGQQMCIILSRPVFLWIVAGLSGLYFVVTGIQFWVTAYMINVLGAAQIDVQTAFAITSLTGPLAGVFFGGWLVDKMGGYKEDQSATANTLKTCLVFGVGALIFAIMTAFVPNFIGGIIGIWLVLFFGGALLPALTGVCMTSVPDDCRAVASSFSMFTYNILGYAAAPLLMGGIADSFVDPLDTSCRNVTKGATPCATEIEGQRVGFQFGMLTACVAIIAVAGAVICQMRLATQGAEPKCLACLTYAAPTESPEEEELRVSSLQGTSSPTSSGGMSRRGRANTTLSPETHRGRSTTVGMIGMVASHQSRGSVIIKASDFFGFQDRDGLHGSDDSGSRTSSRDGLPSGKRERFETDLMSVQEDDDEESSSGSESSDGPDAI
jgi:MFS family permease